MAEHFRKLVGTPTHAGVFILPDGNDIEYIVIDHLEEKKSEVVNGVKKGEVVGGVVKDCVVAYFKPNPYTNLGMVMNVTNADRLCKLAKKTSWQLLEIRDIPVRLTSEPSSKGDGLRISKTPPRIPAAPAPKKKPEITDANFDKAVEFLKTKSMEELRGFYEVSAEMEKRLMEKGEDLTQEGAKE